jgi:excisionase family DNA binding protein
MGQGTTVPALGVKLQSEPGKKPNPERLLSLPQAAVYLGISQSTIRRYLKDGKIPFRRVGEKLYKFDLADLQTFAPKISA